ncbi:hypothetical protein METHB2_960004 [Candidatus Methylobacter favarea]|uniref:Uncharacterized protein n=1 Tax=Candidatus Methylobacter favarea TaxID=2707345 RepID=A0A8S0WSR6_9GAMM|nr:hypothetical protein [Candidatus Methylobacter favarea]CAA9893041.1 hypothetical protein METHB2_960004 [Candidatus Methylobacter favarea]
MAQVFETDADHPLQPGDTEGMETFLDEDIPLSTDYDVMIENPPHAHYDGPDLQNIFTDRDAERAIAEYKAKQNSR